jgi:hypothetical protein
MAEGAIIANVAGERDQALHRLQVLAAEIRAHEQTVRHNIVSPWRPADERLYRRLRQVIGGSDDGRIRGVRGVRGASSRWRAKARARSRRDGTPWA